jgi:hypothetical protein
MLDKAGVHYEMPLAPRSTDSENVDRQGDGGSSRPPGPSARRSRADGSADDDGDIDDDLNQMNRGRAEDQPDSEAGRQHQLAAHDWQTGSTLLFRGTAALHALYEFLMNHRSSNAPYFLTIQFLAPLPFTHASPYSPKVVYQSGRRPPGGALGEVDGRIPSRAHDRREHQNQAHGSGEDLVRLEDPDDGPAILMPCVLRRLTKLLQDTQSAGFEITVKSDSAGQPSDALNLHPPRIPIEPREIGMRGVAVTPQPRAKMWIPLPNGNADGAVTDIAWQPAAGRPKELWPPCIGRIRYYERQLSWM